MILVDRSCSLPNAAAALVVTEIAPDLKVAAKRAAEAVDSGKARAVLEGLVRITGG